ncbi:MAG: T9SS type A sorting domain-containing protein [Flavisolibacter sp.]|nr:T9SS type A sorting domain-containing protein [Flavisolibacter sp.]
MQFKIYRVQRSLFAFLFLFASITSLAQGTYTKRTNLGLTANLNGLIDYLPSGYDPNGTARYPLLVFFMGTNSHGDGSVAGLESLFSVGGGFPTDQFRDATWVEAYTVNGVTHKFIVVAPQFVTSYDVADPSHLDVNAVINYAIANYRVDTTRIYLTGNSSGGGPTINYLGADSTGAFGYGNRIAAVVPFSAAYISTIPTQPKANVYRANNVPVWAFHNDHDPGVPYFYTELFVNLINNPTPNTPPAKLTLFNNTQSWGPHNSWYGPYKREYVDPVSGLNIYEWMLQFTRVFSVLPVNFTLFNANCDNGTVKLVWKTHGETDSKQFQIERSLNGRDWNQLGIVNAAGQSSTEKTYTYLDPSAGNNVFYRVVEISIDGRKSYSTVIRNNCKGQEMLSLYPNPVNDVAVMNLNLKQNQKVVYYVSDSKGAIVLRGEMAFPAGNNQVTIQMNYLQRGMYTLNAHLGSGIQSVKFIKN